VCCRRLGFDPYAEIHVNLADADVIVELAALRARRTDHRLIGNWFISASAATRLASRYGIGRGSV
jgi:hypothetical protein